MGGVHLTMCKGLFLHIPPKISSGGQSREPLKQHGRGGAIVPFGKLKCLHRQKVRNTEFLPIAKFGLDYKYCIQSTCSYSGLKCISYAVIARLFDFISEVEIMGLYTVICNILTSTEAHRDLCAYLYIT